MKHLLRQKMPLAMGIAIALAVSLAPATAAQAAPVVAADVPATIGTTYYVDCSTAAGGAGTVTEPLSSLAAVAALTLVPGDAVLFKRGAVCTGALTTNGSGTAENPIVIDAYGDAEALPRLDGNGVPSTVTLSNQEYWEIRNLEITNTDPVAGNRFVSMRRGLVVSNTDQGQLDHFRIEDLYIHDVTGQNKKDLDGSGGIQFEVRAGSVPSWFNDVVIAGNRIENVNRSGINMSTAWLCRQEMAWDSGFCTKSNPARNPWTPSTGLVIRDNQLDGIGGDGIVVQMNDGALVEGNTVNDAANRANQGSNAGVWAWNADNTTFQHNTVSNTKQLAGNNDGTSFDIDYGTRNTVFQYNTSYSNAGGMVFFCGCASGWLPNAGFASEGVYRYNVSIAEETRSGFLAGATDGAFYNNTFLITDPRQSTFLSMGGDGSSVLFANNLFVSLIDKPLAYSAGTVNHVNWRNNAFFGSGTTWPGTVDAGNKYLPTSDLSSLAIVQALATGANYDQNLGELDLSSLAVAENDLAAAGTPVAEEGVTDFFGNAVPSYCAPDIGAFQFSSFDDASCSAPATITAGTPSTITVPASSTIRIEAKVTAGTQLAVTNALGRSQTARAVDATSGRVAAVVRTTANHNALTLACTGGDCAEVKVSTVADAIVDGSFESPYTGRASDTRSSPWGIWNAARSTSQVATGSYSLSLTTGAESWNGASSELVGIAVEPGALYDVSGWVRSTRVGTSGTTLGAKWGAGTVETNTSFSAATTAANTFQHLSARVPMGASQRTATFFCWQPGGLAGTSYCDDITMTKVAPTGPQFVVQPRSATLADGDTVQLYAGIRSDFASSIAWESSVDGGPWTPLTRDWSGVEVAASGPWLSIGGLTTDDSGIRYRAVATNATNGEAVISDAAEITIGAARGIVETTPPAELDVVTVVDSRCLAAKAQLTVTATNGDAVPVTITFTSAYGTKTLANVAPGKNAFHSFSTRLGTLPTGEVTVTAVAIIDGETVTTEWVIPHAGRTC